MIFRILRNMLALVAGHVVAKLFSLGCIIFLARWFGVSGFGIYGTVMAYLTLFATISEGGIGTITIRDVASDRTRNDWYYANALILRLILAGIAYIPMVFLGSIWKKGEYSFLFLLGAGLFLFPETLRRLALSFFSAYERMDIVALCEVLSVFMRYIPFFIAILIGKSLFTAFILFVLCWSCLALGLLMLTRKYYLSRRKSLLRGLQLQNMLYEAFPFGMLSIVAIIHFKADTIMLSKMQGNMAVGFYEAAYKFIEAAMFIPGSIVNVLLPVMASRFATDKPSYNKVYLHSVRILGIGILPVAIGVSFCAPDIIRTVYGEAYLPSAPALSLLIWALVFMCLNAPVGNVIATSHSIHRFLPYSIANVLLNVLLNGLLIPKYSFLGASFVAVFTKATGFVLQLYFTDRILGTGASMLRIISKLGATGIVTSLTFYLVKQVMIFPFNAMIPISVYLICLMVFHLIEPEDQRLWIEFLRKVKMKFALKR